MREADNECASFEELCYFPALLDEGRRAKRSKKVENARHPLGLAEGTSCMVQCRCLHGREVVVR